MSTENELRILRTHLLLSGGIPHAGLCRAIFGHIRRSWAIVRHLRHGICRIIARECPTWRIIARQSPAWGNPDRECPAWRIAARERPSWRNPARELPAASVCMHARPARVRERHCPYSRGSAALFVRLLRAQYSPCARGDGVESLLPRRNGVLPRLYWCLLIRYDAAPRARRREPHGRRCDHLRRHFHRTRYIA